MNDVYGRLLIIDILDTVLSGEIVKFQPMVYVCLSIGIPSTRLEAMLDAVDNLALKKRSQDWVILRKVEKVITQECLQLSSFQWSGIHKGSNH